MEQEFLYTGRIEKVDETLGLVFGWLMISKIREEVGGPLIDYVDVQGHNITDDGILKAASDFMLNSRMQDDQHNECPSGQAVFAMPMTQEIADAYGFGPVPMTGLMFAAKPSPESLSKFKVGDFTGFSIGGAHLSPPIRVPGAA